ncbi:MAG: transposase [Candidatus Electryonea clarkiae]|nr:transposase [Candidatus Electryonea clarkiae]MDP8287998.1 transposase [Candidatus Electryonea clarkiae]
MPHRYNDIGHAHFLTFGCFRHKWLFRNQHLCKEFTYHLDSCRCDLDFELWAFVIMPNHVHLLLNPKDNLSISKLLSRIKSPFAFHALDFIKKHDPQLAQELSVIKVKKPGSEESGHSSSFRFWRRGGGYDRNIFGDEAVRKTIEYINNNPVRAGMAEYPEDYLWSSARFWLCNKPEPINMDIPEWL